MIGAYLEQIEWLQNRLAELEAELAVAKRALELACVEWAYLGGYRGEDAAEKLIARTIAQARKE